MLPVSVGDALLAKILEDSFNYILCLNAIWIPTRLNWHLLYRENVHLILDFKAKDVGGVRLHGLARCEERKREDMPVSIVRSHVDDSASMLATSMHLGPEEPAHHYHGERVHICRLK